jgi:anti-sigma-K factor RsiG
MEETFPDIGAMSDEELKATIDELTADEHKVSYDRRMLHGKIDILRAELVNRLRTSRESGNELISGADVEKLTDILAGRVGGEDPL